MAPREIDHVPPAPALSVRRKDGYAIVKISGEIDIARTPVLREQLLGLLRPGARRLVVDLSGVTFCDASGLAVLVGVARRVGLLGGSLRLAAPPPLMSTVLRLTGLDSRFEIFATVPEAIGARAHRSVRDADVFPAGNCGVPGAIREREPAMVFTGPGCSGSSCSCHSACEVLTAAPRIPEPGFRRQAVAAARGSHMRSRSSSQ